MTLPIRRARHAMFATVSPAALLLAGLLASPAIAVDQVVAEGETRPAGVVLANGNSLTNRGTIRNPAGNAVGAPGNVTFILNGTTGKVEANTDFAIGVAGNLDRFENNGSVTTNTNAALGVGGNVGTFFNTGTMSGQSGFGTNGNVDTFTNSGTGKITATTFSGVGFGGTVGTFENAGSIRSNTSEAASFNSAVNKFTNSGTLEGGDFQAVYFQKGVNSFVNTSTGVIRNINNNGNNGNGVGLNIDTVNGGKVVSFENHGRISSDPAANGTGVAFFENGNGALQVDTFVNSGTITGTGNGVNNNGSFGNFSNTSTGFITSTQFSTVRSVGNVGTFNNAGRIAGVQSNGVSLQATTGTFTNSGTITSEQSNGANFGGPVGSFSNSGTISGRQNGVSLNGGVTTLNNSGSISGNQFSAIYSAGNVGTFINETSGRISSSQNAAIAFDGNTGAFTNNGTIESTNQNAVYLRNATDTITNTGTIAGQRGIDLDGTGAQVLVNSGTIIGRNGSAVFMAGGDDTVRLLTGSRIQGDVAFGGGNDTLDVSGYAGNALLRVFGLENVVSGDRLTFRNQPNNLVGVVEANGVVQGGQAATLGLATQINTMMSSVLDGAIGDTSSGSIEPLGYMPVAPQTAADLAIVDAPAPGATAWATAIGGDSRDSTPVDVNSHYGALLAGTHAQFATDTTLGVMGGVGSGRVDSNNGGQIVDSVTGIGGFYGRHEAGVATFDFSVLAGVAGNTSARQVAAPGGLETARAGYSSWFVSPAVGVAVPVLSLDNGEVDFVGKVSYIGGSVAGYTETGSSMNLTVGDQSIGLLDARIGLAGTFDVGNSGTTTVTANGGLLIQSNIGGAAVPITFLGQTQNAALPGSTDLGVYGGLGLSTRISSNVSLSAGADAQWKFNGDLSGAVRVGISADF